MKKIVAALLATAMMAGSLVGCSSKTENNGQKTLDVVWFSDGEEGKSFLRLAKKYEEENPDIKIELIEVPFADFENKITNMINAKEAPALARLRNLGLFENQLLDLSGYVSDKDAFVNNFGNGLRFVFDGKILAAPMDLTANGLLYNKTAFEQAGVKVPQSPEEVWTWEEWKEAMKTVMANSDCKYGLVVDKTPHRFSTLMYQAGAGMLNEDLTAPDINTPEMHRTVSFFKELHDEKIIPDSVWLGSENPNELFRTGQVAMHLSGSWMIANYKEEIKDFEWGVTYLPKDKERASVPGGKYIGAFQNSGVEKEAAAFIEWLSKAENNAVYCQENSFLSPVKGNEELEYDYGTELFATFAEELAVTGPRSDAEWGYQAFTGVIQLDMKDRLVDVLAGKITVDEYLVEMDQLFTETLEEIK